MILSIMREYWLNYTNNAVPLVDDYTNFYQVQYTNISHGIQAQK